MMPSFRFSDTFSFYKNSTLSPFLSATSDYNLSFRSLGYCCNLPLLFHKLTGLLTVKIHMCPCEDLSVSATHQSTRDFWARHTAA